MMRCPVLYCGCALKGRGAVLCSDHYFQLNAIEARLLLRMRANADHAVDGDQKAHLEEQFQAQLTNALRKITPTPGGQSVE